MSSWKIKNNSTGRVEEKEGGLTMSYDFPQNDGFNPVNYTVWYISDNGVESPKMGINVKACPKCDYKVIVTKVPNNEAEKPFEGLTIAWKDADGNIIGQSVTNASGEALLENYEAGLTIIPTMSYDDYTFTAITPTATCNGNAKYRGVQNVHEVIINPGVIKVNWQWNGNYIWEQNVSEIKIYHREKPNVNLLGGRVYIGIHNCPCGEHACTNNNKLSIISWTNDEINLGVLEHPLSEYFINISYPYPMPATNHVAGRTVGDGPGECFVVTPYWCVNYNGDVWNCFAGGTNYDLNSTLDKVIAGGKQTMTVRAFDSASSVPDYC